MTRIADNDKRTKHSEEIAFFDALVIDLKKTVLATGPIPLTGRVWHEQPMLDMERLQEATKHLSTLSECKEQVRRK